LSVVSVPKKPPSVTKAQSVPTNAEARKDGCLAYKITRRITNHAQEKLSDVTLVELPHVGEQVKKGGAVGVVESRPQIIPGVVDLAGIGGPLRLR
jgi:glycine cleavage system H lipoate-binding protein